MSEMSAASLVFCSFCFRQMVCVAGSAEEQTWTWKCPGCSGFFSVDVATNRALAACAPAIAAEVLASETMALPCLRCGVRRMYQMNDEKGCPMQIWQCGACSWRGGVSALGELVTARLELLEFAKGTGR